MGSVVKGISSAVSSVTNAVGGAVSGLVKGISEFAKSPLGQLAIQAGLAYVTGGSSLMAGGGLSSLLGGGGVGAGLSSLFGGGGASNLIGSFAQQFMGDAASGVSGSGVGALAGLTQGMDSNQLLATLTSLLGAQGGPQSADGSQQGSLANMIQLFASQHAQTV